MLAVRSRILWLTLAGASIASAWAANFGTVVPINGTVSDVALDERRNVVWAANFSAYRVEQVSIASKSLLTPLIVPMPPSAVAISPNRRFLLVGEYQKPDPAELSTNPFAPETGGYTLFDLDANLRYDVNLNSPVLSVAFGADNNAIILTRIPVPADPTNPGPADQSFSVAAFSRSDSDPHHFHSGSKRRSSRSAGQVSDANRPGHVGSFRRRKYHRDFWLPQTPIRPRLPQFRF